MLETQRKPRFVVITHVPQNFFAANPHLSVVTCIENIASNELFAWMQEQQSVLFYGGGILHRWLTVRSGTSLLAQDGSYQLYSEDTVVMIYTGPKPAPTIDKLDSAFAKGDMIFTVLQKTWAADEHEIALAPQMATA